MELTETQNTDSNITWSGPLTDHGDFPFRILVTIEPMEDHGQEAVDSIGAFLATVKVVSVVAAAEKIDSACNSFGMDRPQFDALSNEWQHMMLADYGVAAPVWQKGGNDEAELTKLAKEEACKVDMLLGFYMDRQLNALGATGWDFIKGEFMPSKE